MSVKCEIYKKVPCNLTLRELEERLKEGRKQGALEELKRTYKDIDILWSKVSLDFVTASKIKDILYKRIKELEEGVSE